MEALPFKFHLSGPALCTMLFWVMAGQVHAGPPPAPTVTWPPAGATVNSNRLDITWTGGSHDQYEVHIGFYNVSSSAEGWNSGTVNNTEFTATSGPLAVQQTYYVYVRNHNVDGWGPWSQPNVHFYIAGEWLNDPYFVAGTPGQQWPQHAAFNPARNEYLIAYRNIISGQEPHVAYYRLDSTGAKIGVQTEITDDAYLDGERDPLVAYNSVNAEYLIAYSGWLNDNTPQLHDDVRVQRVNAATGALIGGSALIHSFSSGGAAYEMDMSYSPVSNVYFVIWKDTHLNPDAIMGFRLSGTNGAVLGSYITVSSGWARLCVNPSVAYNSVANEFMVMYQVDREDINHGWDLYCQRVNASTGALIGGTMPIATNAPAWDHNGDLAYDSNLNRYLVVYEDLGAGVWGHLMNPNGTLIGSRFMLSTVGGVVNVDWNSNSKEYEAAWQDCCSPDDYARRISQAGVPIGEIFKVTTPAVTCCEAGPGSFEPIPIANPLNNEFLHTWYRTFSDVYVRRHKAYSVPTDTTAPSPVTGFTLQRFPSSITLNWTNPSTSDFMGTRIRYKTTGFPTGPTDGLQIADVPNAPSTADTFTHTGLVQGTTYYYAVFALDEALNYSTAALAGAKVFAADFDGDDDVDITDFSHLQNCFSGAGVPYDAGCTNADIDEDDDVDQSDFTIFLPCLAGANVAPGC